MKIVLIIVICCSFYYSCNPDIKLINKEKETIKLFIKHIKEGNFDLAQDLIEFGDNLPFIFSTYNTALLNGVVNKCESVINKALDQIEPKTNKAPNENFLQDVYTLNINNSCFDTATYTSLRLKFLFYRSLNQNKITNIEFEVKQSKFNLPKTPEIIHDTQGDQ
jgi:hypothetical protein